MGRTLRAPVAHIEGGLRSYDLRHPFPEELNRSSRRRWPASTTHRGVGRVEPARRRDRRHRLEHDPRQPGARLRWRPPFRVPDEPFGIVCCTASSCWTTDLLTETIERARRAVARTPLLFIDHPVNDRGARRASGSTGTSTTRRSCESRACASSTLSRPAPQRLRRHRQGGSQEECYYLDLPCLVHRVKTERREGLGENALLSQMRADVLHDFLADPSRFRRIARCPSPRRQRSSSRTSSAEASSDSEARFRRRRRSEQYRRTGRRFRARLGDDEGVGLGGRRRVDLQQQLDTPRVTSTLRSKCIVPVTVNGCSPCVS